MRSLDALSPKLSIVFSLRLNTKNETHLTIMEHLLLLLLLLFRHSAKISVAHQEHLVTSLELVTSLHLPHAIIVALYVLKTDVVILRRVNLVVEQ